MKMESTIFKPLIRCTRVLLNEIVWKEVAQMIEEKSQFR